MQECSNNSDSMLQNYYEFLKDEILIRVESIKVELDEMYDKFCVKMDESKKEAIKTVNESKKEIDKSLNSAKDFLRKFEIRKINDDESENLMYSCDETIINLEKLETDLRESIHNFKFKPNEDKLQDVLIGDLSNKCEENG